MSMMPLKLANPAFVVALHLIFMACGFGDEFQYFNGGVDYWNEGKEKLKRSENIKAETNKEIPKTEESFAWTSFLDPKNKEFFREGEYLPPEPFMELVRNPSDENIKMWFAYMDKKNELAQRLEIKVAQYAERNGLAEQDKVQLKAKVTRAVPVSLDAKQYRFRMYFSSTCPHCQKMMGTLNELQEKGYFVEGRQTDAAKGIMQLPFPTEPASKAELSQKGVQSVPLLLVGDLKNKVVYRLSGYQTTEDVINAIAQNDLETKRLKNSNLLN